MQRDPSRLRKAHAFTVIELLVVMAIIIVLAGLILATSGYVQEKSKRSRAEAEIAAMSAALESYKADNGIYPTEATETETIDPNVFPADPKGSKFLYAELSGDTDLNGVPESNSKSYMAFTPQNLQAQNPAQPIGAGNLVAAIRDPFGDPYGYSTARAAGGTIGYNPTFDLWSTAGTESGSDQAKWITNW